MRKKVAEQSELRAIKENSLVGVLRLPAKSFVKALTGASLQPRLRPLLVSMETIQSGLKP